MTQAGFYGQTVRRFLHLEHEPPSLITRSLRNAEIAVTETRDDTPARSLSGEMGLEDAFVVSLKLNNYPNCELWERGGSHAKADIRAGATYLYDMKNDPQFVIDKPFHSLHFYLPRSALDGIAEQSGAPRVGELPSRLGDGHDDPVIRHIGGALLPALRRPAEINRLFIDYTMLAFTVHVAQTYGGMQPGSRPAYGGLAPWQAGGPRKAGVRPRRNVSLDRSRPSLTLRSAIFHAHFEFPPACRRTNGCFASASRRPSS